MKFEKLWMLVLAGLLPAVAAGCSGEEGIGDDETNPVTCSGDYALTTDDSESYVLADWPDAQLLTDLSDIAHCEVIQGSLVLYGYAWDEDNELQITNLNSLSNLISVGGDLELDGLVEVSNLDGLSNLTSVGGELFIAGLGSVTLHTGLSDISGLSSLSSVEGRVAIFNNIFLCQDSVDAFIEGCTIGGGVQAFNNCCGAWPC